MTFCPFSNYKNILGFPNKGIHKLRFLDTAIIDYIGTIFIAISITYISNKKLPLVFTTIILFILGEILHMLFGIETNTLKFLQIKCN